MPKAKFSSCNSTLDPLGVIVLPLIFPHSKGSLRLDIEFVVMEDILSNHLILGNDALCLYGIDIIQSRGRYFTIGGDWKRKFQICNINSSYENTAPIPCNELSEIEQSINNLNKELSDLNKEYFSQASLSDKLSDKQKEEILEICYQNSSAFCTSDNPIGNVQGNDMELTLTLEAPYPPLLRRPPYPSSPKSRVALEEHIQNLSDLKFLRKVGHNELVDIKTPVIIAWQNEKSTMVGDFRA